MATETLASNEEAALAAWEHRDMLKGVIAVIIRRNPDLAAETLSDVNLAIITSWHRFDSTRSFGNWATGVARNVARSNLRKYRGQKEDRLTDSAVDQFALTYEEVGHKEHVLASLEALRHCTKLLPVQQRRLLHLRYFKNQEYPALSTGSGKSVGALRVFFKRLRGILRTCVRKELSKS